MSISAHLAGHVDRDDHDNPPHASHQERYRLRGEKLSQRFHDGVSGHYTPKKNGALRESSPDFRPGGAGGAPFSVAAPAMTYNSAMQPDQNSYQGRHSALKKRMAQVVTDCEELRGYL